MTLRTILDIFNILPYWEEKKLSTGIKTRIDYKGHVKVFYPMNKFIKYNRQFLPL